MAVNLGRVREHQHDARAEHAVRREMRCAEGKASHLKPLQTAASRAGRARARSASDASAGAALVRKVLPTHRSSRRTRQTCCARGRSKVCGLRESARGTARERARGRNRARGTSATLARAARGAPSDVRAGDVGEPGELAVRLEGLLHPAHPLLALGEFLLGHPHAIGFGRHREQLVFGRSRI